ncbi:transposase [Bacillus cereus]|nr:transposase [Bacillus cereus]
MDWHFNKSEGIKLCKRELFHKNHIYKEFGRFCRMDLPLKTTTSHSNQPTIESLQAQVEEFTAKLRWYEEQFRLSQQKRFGTSSEKTLNNQLALEWFNEAEKVILKQPNPLLKRSPIAAKRNLIIRMSLPKTFQLKWLNIVYRMRNRFARSVVVLCMR